MAREILDDMTYEGQRPLSRNYILFLRNEMQEGRFDNRNSPIIFGEHDNGSGRTVVLIDGYHRLEAIAEGDKTYEFDAKYIPYENDDELALIYSRIDQGRKRSVSDTFAAFGLLEDARLTRTDMNRLGSATRLIDAGFAGLKLRIPLEVHKNLIEEWAPEMREMVAFLAGKDFRTRGKFLIAPVLSIALVTLRHNHDMAVEFWKGAIDDDGLKVGDPRKAFLQFMDKYAHGHGGDYRSFMPRKKYLMYVARAWNNWVEGATVSSIRVKSAVEEMEIATTPYVIT